MLVLAGAAVLFGGSGEGDADYHNDVWMLHMGPNERQGLAAGQIAWQQLPCR